jgi:plastocyanin
VTGNEMKVTISDNDIEPIEIVMKAGQRIRWINSGSIPHVLESTTLKDEKGKTMETTAIFPGSEVTYDIPATTLDGSYDYESRMSKKINGRIVIQNSMTTSTSSVAPSKPVVPMPVAPVANPSSSSISSSSSSSVATTVVPNNDVINTTMTKNIENLPVNPNTVGKGTTSPITKNMQATAITTHRPTKQPESGTSAWIIAFCGIAALYGVMKKASV